MRARSIIWNGVIYNSISEAAKVNGIEPGTMRWRLNMGYSSDQDMSGPSNQKIPIQWNNQLYESISQASKHTGLSDKTLKKWIIRGCKSDYEVRRAKERAYKGLNITPVLEYCPSDELFDRHYFIERELSVYGYVPHFGYC